MLIAAIAAASSGDNAIVAGATGYKYRVIAFVLSFGGTVNAKWLDGAGGTAKTGLFYGTLGIVVPGQALPMPTRAQGPQPLFETASGGDLTLNLSTNVAVGGYVVYEKVPASV